jgi:hypothetical protein
MSFFYIVLFFAKVNKEENFRISKSGKFKLQNQNRNPKREK